jgi:hypothetical protein
MKNELAFIDYDRGFDVARALLDEGYVVMLSYEEEFLILTYEWSENGANRNDIVFMRCEELADKFDEQYEDIMNDVAKDFSKGTLANRLAPRIAKWKQDISSI